MLSTSLNKNFLCCRVGWFMPKYTVDRFWHDHVIADHWRALFLPRVVKVLSWRHRLESLGVCRNHTCPVVSGPGCVVSGKGRSNCSTVFTHSPGTRPFHYGHPLGSPPGLILKFEFVNGSLFYLCIDIFYLVLDIFLSLLLL